MDINIILIYVFAGTFISYFVGVAIGFWMADQSIKQKYHLIVKDNPIVSVEKHVDFKV